nr:ribonucleoside-diphosphate reductase subunit alpha [Thalassospira xiamenensis]
MAMLKELYLLPGEGVQDRFANVAAEFADDADHAQRMYDYISNHWMMPATPVLSSAGTNRGMPISCFLNECQDSLPSIKGLWAENIELASRGGGIGSYWGNLRSLGERVGKVGKTSGVVPFMKVQDSLSLAISQGSLRRGSAASYLPVWHPEIEEFIEMRRATGGDPNRKTLNMHHGVAISDAFMHAVEKNDQWALKSPHTGETIRSISARALWIRLLTARMETGEPYLLFIDTVNRAIPEHHKKSGLIVKTSNLCVEITLPTGLDHLGRMRTAVCCLSSLNLEKFDEWNTHPTFIEDVMRFLDNVLSFFIANAPSMTRAAIREVGDPIKAQLRELILDEADYAKACEAVDKAVGNQYRGLMDDAIYAASRERSVGLGAMGFHSFLQAKGIPFDGVMAKVWNKRMFGHIKDAVDAASEVLAEERGACPDAEEHGVMARFSNKTAIAPTASISVIAGQCSPGIDPVTANVYSEKRLVGTFEVRNKHLKKVLASYGRDDEATWRSITRNEGSVQHLEFLSDLERDVFKTANEIDQMWVVEHASDRAPLVDQSQSVNLFLRGDIHKQKLHQIHWAAWKKGVKSLYYCRSLAVKRAQKISEASTEVVATFANQRTSGGAAAQSVEAKPQSDEALNGAYDECLACQ